MEEFEKSLYWSSNNRKQNYGHKNIANIEYHVQQNWFQGYFKNLEKACD